MRVCVDTSILIDVLKDEFREYQELFYAAMSAGEVLVIPSIVFAELLPQFQGNTQDASQFLGDHAIRVESLDREAASVASQRWMKYLRKKTKIICPHCLKPLPHTGHVLSDFYIGGFALTRCDALLTRDRGIFRKYFRELKSYRDDIPK
jgi:predicted nucleic acid-binding protein